MRRRNTLIILLAFAVVLFSVIGYFTLKGQPDSTSPFQAFSDKTSAVLTINNYRRAIDGLLLNSLIWQELMRNEDVKLLSSHLGMLDSLIRNDEWSSSFAEDSKWYVSYQLSDSGFGHTLVIPMATDDISSISEWYVRAGGKVEVFGTFEEVEILKYKAGADALPPLYACFHKGLFIASTKGDLTEDAIKTLNSVRSLWTEASFRQVEKTAGSFADWNFYINYRDASALRLLGLNAAELAMTGLVWGDWTALDATLHSDMFLLSGFSHVSQTSYLGIFSNQKSQDIDALDVIPDRASVFIHFGISNYNTYQEAKKKFFSGNNRMKAYSEKLARIKSEYSIDLESEFSQFVANEFGIMYLPYQGIESAVSKVAFFRLSDIRRASATLESMSLPAKGDFQRLGVADFLGGFESEIFSGIDSPYYAFIDKYLLISANDDLLAFVRNQYMHGSTMKMSASYAAFAGNLSDQSNVYLYINLESGYDVCQRVLTSKAVDFLSSGPDIRAKIGRMGIQFKDGKKDLFYQHLAMTYIQDGKSEGSLLWELALDTDLMSRPFIVYNHLNNAREILVQDVANNIYLIDNKGNLLWKRRMKEKIVGEVSQIDVFRNNKLQMLFSGESSVYLIDRKGRDVENFPVVLPSNASNSIRVVDYEKNREYRILVGIKGGRVINLNRYGKEIEGWKFRADGEISYPVEYFTLGGKDYVIAVTSDGKPNVINRRGEIRLELKESLPPFDGRPYVLELSNEIGQCRLVTTDASGNFIKLRLNGEKEVVNLGLTTGRHDFIYTDLNKDRKFDYVLMDSIKLVAFNSDREKLFEAELEEMDADYLGFFGSETGNSWIGFTDVRNKEVYLYGSQGSLSEDSPYKGNTPSCVIDLNKDGRQNLLVGLDKKLMVYNLR